MEIGFYDNAPKIGRIGMAFFETITSTDKKEVYYSNTEK